MKNPKILFVPLPYHLRFLYDFFSEMADCQAFVDQGLFETHPRFKSHMIASKMPAFGLYIVKKLLKIETQMPMYIKGFSRYVKKIQPEYLICFDFYHWYFLQSINYAHSNPKCKIVLYSETKRWPNNLLSRISMRFFLWFTRRNLKSIEQVIVYTEEGKRWWSEQVPQLPVSILPAPVDVEMFRPVTHKDWLPNEKLRILMNARYNPYKRHEDLLQAVTILREQGKLFHITFIGRPDISSATVEKLVSKYRLENDVTFLDPLPMNEMPILYHQHDVLVLPSYNEAIGMVVPEAMACGLPTITSDTVGANVYVEEGMTGYIFETGNHVALAEVLSNFYNKSELEKSGSLARQRVASKFSIPIVAKSLFDLLDARV